MRGYDLETLPHCHGDDGSRLHEQRRPSTAGGLRPPVLEAMLGLGEGLLGILQRHSVAVAYRCSHGDGWICPSGL